MTRRIISLLILCGISTTSIFGDRVLFTDSFDFLGEWKQDSGKWAVVEGALRQESPEEKIATISREVLQKGIVEYKFDVGYISGIDDLYGGFGIHILVDNPTRLRSWGQNSSYLFWLTYDEEAYGFENVFAQVYRSIGPIHMDFHRMIGSEFPVPTHFLIGTSSPAEALINRRLRIRLVMDTQTGRGRLYSPARPHSYYEIDLGQNLGSGKYISLRTNSLALTFDNVSVRIVDEL